MMPPPGCVADPHIHKMFHRRLVPSPSPAPDARTAAPAQFALEDVALGQSEFALEVERCQDLPVQDDVADVRRVLGDRVDDRVAEGFALDVQAGALAMSIAFEVYGAYWTKHDRMCLPAARQRDRSTSG